MKRCFPLTHRRSVPSELEIPIQFHKKCPQPFRDQLQLPPLPLVTSLQTAVICPGAESQGSPGPPNTLTIIPSPTPAHLVCLVEEQAEVGEDDPQFLPAIAVLELPQQIPRELVLTQKEKRSAMKSQVSSEQPKAAPALVPCCQRPPRCGDSHQGPSLSATLP